MSITDELREWAGQHKGWHLFDMQLNAIADRIDTEHDHTVMSAMNDALYHANDKNMAELGWIRLPVDADGELIHIGDRVENNERVVRIVLTDGSWEPYVYVEQLPNVLHEYFCNEVSHYHEPTVEDVLRKFAEGLGVPVADSYVAAAAAKLRLAGDADA